MCWDVEGSPTTPQGYVAGVAACGLKTSGDLDLALIASREECAGAGVFTRNRVVGAPVTVDRQVLKRSAACLRGLAANSGNANACTGKDGLQAARAMQRLTAEALNCRPDQILVISTGVIGVPLDMRKVARGIAAAASSPLSRSAGRQAAQAIMTTDTHPKHLAITADLPGGAVTIGGMAKGAGMIHPDMATMLAVITSDVAAPPQALRDLLRQAVACSFNNISVDGDTSTNDSLILLANGARGVTLDEVGNRILFSRALNLLCVELARAIVRDGEGAARHVTLRVEGARHQREARQVGRTIAASPLVKAALAGGDPNWGRILAAAGRSGVRLDPGRLALWVSRGEEDDLQLVDAGCRARYDEGDAGRIFALPEFNLRLHLGRGTAAADVWMCDLTQEYVRINAAYRT
jgi:glutamate N-acetyltransferase / amino-acid N-acetyltransferase